MTYGEDKETLLDGKRILITGGTGSLGKVLIQRLLSGQYGTPEKIVIFSRDEAKQYLMRLSFRHLQAATEEIIYPNFEDLLEFRIGDVRDLHSVAGVLRDADIVFNAAAMKQVPICEYFPHEAVRTNIEGAENIVRGIQQFNLAVETVIAVSTDKACKPVNVMGMTKAIQERLFMSANLRCPGTRFIGVRYGNVLASRGSVIPLFHSQIRAGGPLAITSPDMTRFLLSLDQAVQTIMDAYRLAWPGEVFVPRVCSSLIINVAKALIGNRNVEIEEVGIRPGEKIHEILVAEDEVSRTVRRGDYYAIRSILPEVDTVEDQRPPLTGEYSSADNVMDLEETTRLLRENQLMVEDVQIEGGELLR
jgi:FlaA1/EpsC-like NDP-sugar epimerase